MSIISVFNLLTTNAWSDCSEGNSQLSCRLSQTGFNLFNQVIHCILSFQAPYLRTRRGPITALPSSKTPICAQRRYQPQLIQLMLTSVCLTPILCANIVCSITHFPVLLVTRLCRHERVTQTASTNIFTFISVSFSSLLKF